MCERVQVGREGSGLTKDALLGLGLAFLCCVWGLKERKLCQDAHPWLLSYAKGPCIWVRKPSCRSGGLMLWRSLSQWLVMACNSSDASPAG